MSRGIKAKPETLAAFHDVCEGATVSQAAQTHKIKKASLDQYVYRKGGAELSRVLHLTNKILEKNNG